jgi:hypothetical protein
MLGIPIMREGSVEGVFGALIDVMREARLFRF